MCDDCFLGITDILAEVAILNLKIERQKSLEPVPDFNKLMPRDVADEGKLIRKVRKETIKRNIYLDNSRNLLNMQIIRHFQMR